MYFDVQVNGAFGVDFNSDDLQLDPFASCCEALKRSGVQKFYPTIITDSIEAMCAKIQRIMRFRAEESSLSDMVAGLHVEGPFLSIEDGYRGTHPKEHIQEASLEGMRALVDAAEGSLKMVTLAPEVDPKLQVTRFLSEHGVNVFAGHTNASLECLDAAIDSGLIGFTHLGNGCSMQMHRHDNILQRILARRSKLSISVIADGIHVPFWLLKSWLELFGPDRVLVTSDSMSAAGMPPGEYLIGGQPILVDEERRTKHREHSYLAGSASTMNDMFHIRNKWIDDSAYNESEICKLFYGNARTLNAA